MLCLFYHALHLNNRSRQQPKSKGRTRFVGKYTVQTKKSHKRSQNERSFHSGSEGFRNIDKWIPVGPLKAERSRTEAGVDFLHYTSRKENEIRIRQEREIKHQQIKNNSSLLHYFQSHCLSFLSFLL